MKDDLIYEKVLDLAVQIQQIPSPTFGERQRAEFVQEKFRSYGAREVTFDDSGNVLTCIRGQGKKPPLVISAHLDTVFPFGTDLAHTRTGERIAGPGIGDNALGLAALLSLYTQFSMLQTAKNMQPGLAGDLWLVANTSEEGLGDLKGMKAVCDRFAGKVAAYLVLEGMTIGHIYSRGLGVRRYRISVQTRGGHSWVDYGSPSAIHEIAELIVQLTRIDIAKEPRSSMNVGVITGGTSVNTIAAEAHLELDLRSEGIQELTRLAAQVETLVNKADHAGGNQVHAQAKVIGDRPAGELPAGHPLIKTAIACFTKEGITPFMKVGSTDANVPLSRGYPAICFGLTTGGGTHSLQEYIDTKPFSQGFKILVDLIHSISQW